VKYVWEDGTSLIFLRVDFRGRRVDRVSGRLCGTEDRQYPRKTLLYFSLSLQTLSYIYNDDGDYDNNGGGRWNEGDKVPASVRRCSRRFSVIMANRRQNVFSFRYFVRRGPRDRSYESKEIDTEKILDGRPTDDDLLDYIDSVIADLTDT
jgi:hypothetical protein